MADDFRALAARRGARGCTQDEIAQVEADQGVRLPAAYRELLAALGRDTGGLAVGSDLTFPGILGARADAVELFEENEVGHLLPASAVVVMIHQGYVVDFVDTADGQDPPVREWGEGQDDPQVTTVVAPDLLTWALHHERAAGSAPGR